MVFCGKFCGKHLGFLKLDFLLSRCHAQCPLALRGGFISVPNPHHKLQNNLGFSLKIWTRSTKLSSKHLTHLNIKSEVPAVGKKFTL